KLKLELLRVWGEGNQRRTTIVFVTHSIPEAVFLADRVVVLTPRPGRVASIVPVSLPRPRTVASRATGDFGALTFQIHESLTRAYPSGRKRRTGSYGSKVARIMFSNGVRGSSTFPGELQDV